MPWLGSRKSGFTAHCPFHTLTSFLLTDMSGFFPFKCILADPCDSLTECINSEGSFMCGLCPPGFEGDYIPQAGLEFARNNKQVKSQRLISAMR